MKLFTSYKIKSPIRFIIFLSLSLILVFTAITSFLGNNTANGSAMKAYNVITVEDGDTLWSIASKNKSLTKTKDLRELIYNIEQTNELSQDDLAVGDKLLLPLD